MQGSTYDCAIIGGGIAGLTLAILLAKANKKVILFEKEEYPFNKVCGEYLVDESARLLTNLGLDLSSLDLPVSSKLLLSALSGKVIERANTIKGIGISRKVLDEKLYKLALQYRAEVKTKTKVYSFEFLNDIFNICYEGGNIQAKVLVGAWGRRSNIETQLDGNYIQEDKDKIFIGVKYHIKAEREHNKVEIHGFENGYCGISAIENGLHNLSYITHISNLQAADNNIAQMEKTILSKNPHLAKYFSTATFLPDSKKVISHINFNIRNPVNNHILMIGDTAGSIAPLSGNGMCIGIQSAYISFKNILAFVNHEIGRAQMESLYQKLWNKNFKSRIWYAFFIHKTLLRAHLNNFLIYFYRFFPSIVDYMTKKLHNKLY